MKGRIYTAVKGHVALSMGFVFFRIDKAFSEWVQIPIVSCTCLGLLFGLQKPRVICHGCLIWLRPCHYKKGNISRTLIFRPRLDIASSTFFLWTPYLSKKDEEILFHATQM